MALAPQRPQSGYDWWERGNDPSFNPNVNIKEYAIGGKLITVSQIINEELLKDIPRDVIKEKMAMELARCMVENKLIEFTSQRDISTLQLRIYARCYLAPDGQVKILREIKL